MKRKRGGSKSIEKRFDLYDTAEECADKAAHVFQINKWCWSGQSIPSCDDIFQTLVSLKRELEEEGGVSDMSSTGRLIYYKGKFGHQKSEVAEPEMSIEVEI